MKPLTNLIFLGLIPPPYIDSFSLYKDGISVRLNIAKVLIEQWRKEYNYVRPHSALGYQPPAPEAIMAEVTI
jgi:hypothetical protein